jgi:ribosome-associated heat shock protein Hsp15
MSRARQPNTNSVAEPEDDNGKVRLDKWLFAARFFKTRGLAADAIEAGKVKRNGERVKLSHAVRVGDKFAVGREGLVWDIEVTLVTDKRGNGAAAALMYTETAASIAEREAEMGKRKALFQAGVYMNHRPTKRDRRDLIKYFEPKDS